MDEDLKSFEAELTRLRPVAPSPALEQRIARELAETEIAPRQAAASAKIHWVWFVALPAAAAVALWLSRPGERTSATEKTAGATFASGPLSAGGATSDALKPIAAENVLYSARDEGLVVLEDGTTARRERLQFVDTITWTNPRTKASLRWTVPREEVRVVPISFQ